MPGRGKRKNTPVAEPTAKKAAKMAAAAAAVDVEEESGDAD